MALRRYRVRATYPFLRVSHQPAGKLKVQCAGNIRLRTRPIRYRPTDLPSQVFRPPARSGPRRSCCCVRFHCLRGSPACDLDGHPQSHPEPVAVVVFLAQLGLTLLPCRVVDVVRPRVGSRPHNTICCGRAARRHPQPVDQLPRCHSSCDRSGDLPSSWVTRPVFAGLFIEQQRRQVNYAIGQA